MSKMENKSNTLTKNPVIVEQTYNASPGTIWNALTEPQKMKEWYFNIEQFKPAVGNEYDFYAGDKDKQWLHHWKITEVIPNKKIAYTWQYPEYSGMSLATFELFPEGNKTKVKLTHEGLETFPAEVPELARENFVAGWNELLGKSLSGFLTRS
jgi:uncharacterized protein YndB with AHSA1/START domain